MGGGSFRSPYFKFGACTSALERPCSALDVPYWISISVLPVWMALFFIWNALLLVWNAVFRVWTSLIWFELPYFGFASAHFRFAHRSSGPGSGDDSSSSREIGLDLGRCPGTGGWVH